MKIVEKGVDGAVDVHHELLRVDGRHRFVRQEGIECLVDHYLSDGHRHVCVCVFGTRTSRSVVELFLVRL